MLNPNGFLGLFAGLVLFSAGVMAWLTRRNNRRALSRHPAPQNPGAATISGNMPAALVRLEWNEKYECGNAIIDAQHRRIFELGNALLNATLEQQSKLDVELAFDELMHDVTNHFISEEIQLARTKHPLTADHKETHRQLMTRCQYLAAGFHRDEIKAGDLFSFVSLEVISGHILAQDLNHFGSAKP